MNPKNITIRSFTDSDDPTVIYQLHIEGLKQSDSYISSSQARKNLDQDLTNIKTTYLDNQGDFLLALKDSTVIGMGGLRKIDDTAAEIKRMRVKPEFQGQGIGSMILDALLARAKQLGYQKFILDTAIKQTAAQHLYQSRGFQEYKRGEIHGHKTIYYSLDIK